MVRSTGFPAALAVFSLAAAACSTNPVSPTAPTPLRAPAQTALAVRPGVQCPGGVVGDPPGIPSIHIVGLAGGATAVSGVASNIDASTTRVVLWAQTDQWYVQPYADQPLTTICSDGSWTTSTHRWTRVVALLVGPSYVPSASRTAHPALDRGVLAWDEVPTASIATDRTIDFDGVRWLVKNVDGAGPGPNNYSNSEENVALAADGLHLRTSTRNGAWYCAEVYADRSLGYGTYTFQVAGGLGALDPRAVFSGFIYETETREFDIERSSSLAAPFNTQFVVQPFTRPGNILRFNTPDAADLTFRYTWQPGGLSFAIWEGFAPEPTDASLVRAWEYDGADVPPAGGERMRFNLWLNGGVPPVTGRANEVVIRNFRFQP